MTPVFIKTSGLLWLNGSCKHAAWPAGLNIIVQCFCFFNFWCLDTPLRNHEHKLTETEELRAAKLCVQIKWLWAQKWESLVEKNETFFPRFCCLLAVRRSPWPEENSIYFRFSLTGNYIRKLRPWLYTCRNGWRLRPLSRGQLTVTRINNKSQTV